MPRRTSTDVAFVNQVIDVREQEQWADELSFHPRVFCQLALPYVQPRGNPPVWVRRNGANVLNVRPAFFEAADGTLRPEYPTGTVPRMLITWLATEVRRQPEWAQSRELVCGDNMTDFIRKIGLGDATGGKTGSISRLRKGANRLFDAVISATWEGDPSRDVGRNFVIAEEKQLWWPDGDRNPRQRSMFDSTITLSSIFYKELREHSVPMSTMALRMLQPYGPQALDVYTWLCHRLPFIQQPRIDISWAQLKWQFGSTLADTKQGRSTFEKRFTKNVALVKTIYDRARIDVADHGVTLRRSAPHVPFKELG